MSTDDQLECVRAANEWEYRRLQDAVREMKEKIFQWVRELGPKPFVQEPPMIAPPLLSPEGIRLTCKLAGCGKKLSIRQLYARSEFCCQAHAGKHRLHHRK